MLDLSRFKYKYKMQWFCQNEISIPRIYPASRAYIWFLLDLLCLLLDWSCYLHQQAKAGKLAKLNLLREEIISFSKTYREEITSFCPPADTITCIIRECQGVPLSKKSCIILQLGKIGGLPNC